MSELTDARDHARKMADWTDPREASSRTGQWCLDLRDPGDAERFRHLDPELAPKHDRCHEETCSCACHPRKVIPDAERELWKRMADEIDEHLSREEPAPEDGPGLFEEES